MGRRNRVHKRHEITYRARIKQAEKDMIFHRAIMAITAVISIVVVLGMAIQIVLGVINNAFTRDHVGWIIVLAVLAGALIYCFINSSSRLRSHILDHHELKKHEEYLEESALKA